MVSYSRIRAPLKTDSKRLSDGYFRGVFKQPVFRLQIGSNGSLSKLPSMVVDWGNSGPERVADGNSVVLNGRSFASGPHLFARQTSR